MQIILNEVAPVFMDQSAFSQSDIWGKKVVIEKGERLQIVAASGSGKTSLINFMYGLRKDFKGDIIINQKNTRQFTAEDWATYRSAHISIMFQDLRLFPLQTGRENIEIKRKLNPFKSPEALELMSNGLGIQNKLNQQAQICSYGEKQRIAVVRALQQPFNFILLDEPFSHLDDNNRKKAMQLIEEEATQRNAAIILADLKPIEFFNAQRTLYM
ncbi:MAG: ATP-binding cassette domain-containing protein [Ferruginibacter sp.]|jgi:putative ABC transport system ATP-binding protein|nr:ATP-binding cassette domain-containing protein [Chitinophagaceae bacterium]